MAGCGWLVESGLPGGAKDPCLTVDLGVLGLQRLGVCEQLSISFLVRPDGHAGLLTTTNELAGFSATFLLTNDSE
jgi:hypothetical protein